MNFRGIPITIENPKGSIRRGVNDDGKPWSNKMHADYGFIPRTEGNDGGGVDVFVGPKANSNRVFIIDQMHRDGEQFDEHKCLLGFNSRKKALTAYHKSYGRKYGAHHTVGGVTELSIEAFKEWLQGGGGKEPVAPDVPDEAEYQRGGAVADEGDTPSEFFVLPHDVITHLGRGDPDVGTVVAYDMFASPGYTMANPYILPPETVRDLGHGDLEAGRQVLQQFVAKVREQHQ